MALPSFASVNDVSNMWGELTLEEEERVTAWLATASNNLRLIGRRRGIDIDQYIAGDELLTQAAADAVVEAVRRRLMNPGGVRQRSRTIVDGPFSDTSSETIDSAVSSGGLYFTSADLEWLPAAPSRGLRSFSVRSGFRQ